MRRSHQGFAVLTVAALAAAGGASGHDWYSGRVNEEGQPCCDGEDCAAMADARVRRTAAGYDVEIVPGSHPMVRSDDWRACFYAGAYCTVFAGVHTTAPVTFHFEGKAGISPDGQVHVCIDGADLTQRRIRCLFLGGVS